MSDQVGVAPPEDIVDFFKKNDGFFLATHLNPDGDTLGSACALGMALEKLGKRTILVCRDAVPQQYAFLPSLDRFLTFDAVRPPDIDLSLYRNLVLIDCNEIKRTGLEKSGLASVKFDALAVIDHHEIERPLGDIAWIVPS